MSNKVFLRRDTAANWEKYNPVLGQGEIGVLLDEGKGYKIGDGVTAWNDLEFPANPTSVVQDLDDPDANSVPSTKCVSESLELIQNRLNTILLQAKVTVTASPSVIFNGEVTDVTFTVTPSQVTPESLTLTVGSSEYTGTTSLSQIVSLSATTTAKAVMTYSSMEFTTSIIVPAVYPIYYGFRDPEADLDLTLLTKASIRTSPNGSYSSLCSIEDSKFILLVPKSMTSSYNFTMGGVVFVMTSSSMTIDGIEYYLFTSGGTYTTGAIVNLTVS